MKFDDKVKGDAIIVGLLAASIFFIWFTYNILLKQWVWLLISFVVWFFCSGGFMFNIMEGGKEYAMVWDEA